MAAAKPKSGGGLSEKPLIGTMEVARVTPVVDAETAKFAMPVDSDHKATQFWLFSSVHPHMRAFHLTWLAFFCTFVSTFAAPPLLPVIRDNLSLTATEIGNAGVAAVSGAVFARLAVGIGCDLFGPRLASAAIILLTTPFVYCTSLVSTADHYFVARFFTGFSVATFVSTQYWMSSMFSPPKVGVANAFSAGWGNLGGGAVQLLMPLIYTAIQMAGSRSFTAWRIAFFIPGIMQTAAAILLFALGQDLPDGDFQNLYRSGEKHKDSLSKVFWHAVTNYRAWLLAFTYGYCFGVELTVDNILAQYFYDRFSVNLSVAGSIAASFGLVNLISRPSGGVLSDFLSDCFGMRGRLWGLWAVQTLGGVLCAVLGTAGTLGSSIFVMILFSYFVQAACGLTYGIVPFVSRRSLGVVSGMVAAGGNIGAAVTQLIFFRGSTYEAETGITYMGVMIIVCTLPLALLSFPQWGSMFTAGDIRASAEEYYLGEYSKEEQEKGYHAANLKFADNCFQEGGRTTYASRHTSSGGTLFPSPLN